MVKKDNKTRKKPVIVSAAVFLIYGVSSAYAVDCPPGTYDAWVWRAVNARSLWSRRTKSPGAISANGLNWLRRRQITPQVARPEYSGETASRIFLRRLTTTFSLAAV
jgi:hypothetical protein